MRPKSLFLLVLALGCGLVASIGISRVIDSRQPLPEAVGETVEIYVAMTKISTGDPISAHMVRLEPWPKEKVDSIEGSMTESEELFGRRPRTTIFRGEPILLQKLLGTGSLAGASERIPEGYRIKTIRVDATSEGVNLRDIVSGSTTTADRTAAFGLGVSPATRVKQEERPATRNKQPENKTLNREPAQQHQMVVMRGSAISVVRFKDGKLISEESLGVLSGARASTTKRSGISPKLGRSQQKDESGQKISKDDQNIWGTTSMEKVTESKR